MKKQYEEYLENIVYKLGWICIWTFFAMLGACVEIDHNYSSDNEKIIHELKSINQQIEMLNNNIKREK